MNTIRIIDPGNKSPDDYTAHMADCVVLTRDSRILMQNRPESWGHFGGVVTLFGGHVEAGESPLAAMIRELHEELGARIPAAEATFIGAVSEAITDHSELIHVHFWHDREGTITGCYEGEALTFESVALALAYPGIMDYAAWALVRCRNKGLLG